MDSKSLQYKKVYEALYGEMINDAFRFNPGFSIINQKRPLSALNGRKVWWAVEVIKLYLKGLREGVTQNLPAEPIGEKKYFTGNGGAGANKRKTTPNERGSSR